MEDYQVYCKRLGYDDAIEGLHRKEGQSSYYYEGYVEGQLQQIQWSVEAINETLKLAKK